ncbi:hypothetical protein DFJ63DRAFT_319967 [Scheffersomyces coipomensis]|uniref:uncharacterized protein n=1 Tax=Scheffersomyces coipomensis TaxID=1788519 RepID=UPI00315DC73F
MTQLTPIRGFTNTPVTKVICIITTILALSISVLQLKPYLRLSIDPYIIEYFQYWRILNYQISVVNESDYLLVILLWFHFKNLERFYGSRKYFSIIILFTLYNAAFCFIFMSFAQLGLYYILYILKSVIFNIPPNDNQYQSLIFNEIIPGPLGILSSLYVCYGTFIPVSYHFKILLSKPFSSTSSDSTSTSPTPTSSESQSIDRTPSSKELTLTNHFPIHIIYTLLLLNNGAKSIIPCLVGLLVGKLHIYELLPGSKNWLLSSIIFRFLINPSKSINNGIDLVTRRFGGGYISLGSNDNLASNQNSVTTNPDQIEEAEEILDDNENRNEEHEIRAETPVRPLGSQFLDTFRS